MGFLDQSRVLSSCETRFGRANILAAEDAAGESIRILELAGTYQSASYGGEKWADLPFAYFRGFDAIFQLLPAKSAQRILMMGGGGFAWPKHVLMKRDGVKMDVVEADPMIVDIARAHFHLDQLEDALAKSGRHEALKIIVDDAIRHLSETERSYDAIVNDLFQGATAPADSGTDAFIDDVKRHLAPEGIYAQNVIVDLAQESAHELFELMTKLDGAFEHVCSLEATDAGFGGADNHIILAADAPLRIEGAIPYS